MIEKCKKEDAVSSSSCDRMVDRRGCERKVMVLCSRGKVVERRSRMGICRACSRCLFLALGRDPRGKVSNKNVLSDLQLQPAHDHNAREGNSRELCQVPARAVAPTLLTQCGFLLVWSDGSYKFRFPHGTPTCVKVFKQKTICNGCRPP